MAHSEDRYRRLGEAVLDLAEDALVAGGHGGAEAFRESRQELALFVREVGWDHYGGAHEKITTSATVEAGYPFAFDREDASGLDAGRQFKASGAALQGGNVSFEAQSSLSGVHLQLVDD